MPFIYVYTKLQLEKYKNQVDRRDFYHLEIIFTQTTSDKAKGNVLHCVFWTFY